MNKGKEIKKVEKEVKFEKNNKGIIALYYFCLIFGLIFVLMMNFFDIYNSQNDLNEFSYIDKKDQLNSNINKNKRILSGKILAKDQYEKSIRIINAVTPKDWQNYENEFISFKYSNDKYLVDDEFFDQYHSVYLRNRTESDEDDLDEYLSKRDEKPFIRIKILNSQFDYEANRLDKNIREKWYARSSIEVVKYGGYRLNNKKAYLYLLTDSGTSENSKTFNEYKILIENEKNVILIEAYDFGDNFQNLNDFKDDVERIASSVKDLKKVENNPGEDVLGKRPPKNEEERKQLGEKYLKLAEKSQFDTGDRGSDLTIVVFISVNIDSSSIIPELEAVIPSDARVIYVVAEEPLKDANELQYTGYLISNLGLICASNQGVFHQYKNKIYKNLRDGTGGNNPTRNMVLELGLNESVFNKCVFDNNNQVAQKKLSKNLVDEFDLEYVPTIVMIEDGVWAGEYYGFVGVEGLVEELKRF